MTNDNCGINALECGTMSSFVIAVLMYTELLDARVMCALKLKNNMACGQLNAAVTQPAKNLEPVNAMIAKALVESANELSRTKKVNDMLKTKLTETRSELESARTQIFKITGQFSRQARKQPEADKCRIPNCAVRLASVLERVSYLQDLLAQKNDELDREKAAHNDMILDHTCFLCANIVPRTQRMVTKCCHRFDACANCFAEWIRTSSDSSCPFCRQTSDH